MQTSREKLEDSNMKIQHNLGSHNYLVDNFIIEMSNQFQLN